MEWEESMVTARGWADTRERQMGWMQRVWKAWAGRDRVAERARLRAACERGEVEGMQTGQHAETSMDVSGTRDCGDSTAPERSNADARLTAGGHGYALRQRHSREQLRDTHSMQAHIGGERRGDALACVT